MGSGNHARAYLHLTSRNTLQQLPLGWYAEKGGFWAMSPVFDRLDYPGSTRAVTYETNPGAAGVSAADFGRDRLPEVPWAGTAAYRGCQGGAQGRGHPRGHRESEAFECGPGVNAWAVTMAWLGRYLCPARIKSAIMSKPVVRESRACSTNSTDSSPLTATRDSSDHGTRGGCASHDFNGVGS